MIKVKLNTAAVLTSVRKFAEENKRKSEGMVKKFAYYIGFVATSNTPLGDSVLYQKLYDLRQFWPKEEGMAKANWQFSKDNSFPIFIDSGRDTGTAAINRIQTQMASYRLGDQFYIGNGLPYVKWQLDKENKSPQTMGMGIMKPSLDVIVSVYGARLNEYYRTS